VLKAILAVGERTGDARYREYARRYYDEMIEGDGTIRGYSLEAFNIDHVNLGKALLALYRREPERRYRTALDTLRRQLREQPRTSGRPVHLGEPRDRGRRATAVKVVMHSSTVGLLAVALTVVTPGGGRGGGVAAAAWNPDRGDGTYQNPVLFADYSDPDAIRVGDSFYLVSSSFSSVPAVPVLRSHDLVSWRIVGHVAAKLPSAAFDTPQHGKGVWAPSLRYHAGRFWLYFGDPDRGIFMSTAERAEGPWEPLALVQQAHGWIDPCPLFDDDGSVWLVHAWAKSRAGFNGVLTLRRLSADGRRVVGEGRTVFEGGTRHPTIEGPKLYRRDGWYYIFAPAGGVPTGWQVVLRSRRVQGPYEDRIVIAQGTTDVNGPHQGAWVQTTGGESWFLHFQQRGSWGRVVHLEPMAWQDGWPIVGGDLDRDGTGEPVATWTKPRVGAATGVVTPATSDAFDGPGLGLQWQWPANPRNTWWSLTERPGWLRLRALPEAPDSTLWEAPGLLLQKLTGPAYTATTSVELAAATRGTRAGLVVMGRDYAALALETTTHGVRAVMVVCRDADEGGREAEEASVPLESVGARLRLSVDRESMGRFSLSRDGRSFEPLGGAFLVREGVWVGARAGVFAQAPAGEAKPGYADFDWFRVE
jgi:beta-xylosidase